ncbi:MAG TPA: patatin-like phospholipase family protein [Candidatus Dormibacteraeota bacterium]|nr:patatin-like phospholipase family protein [Candidatus Dormibacteraeota bacterium]
MLAYTKSVMLHWRRDRTAFAISGGGARGAAQVGMLRALIERNITPDLVVGVSIGAWNGAWLAHRPELDWVKQLEEVWRHVTRRTLDMVWWRAARNMVRRKPSLYEGDGLSRFVARHLQVHNFEDLAVPLHTVAIDLTVGTKAVFSHGPLAPAVLASSAIPGIFPPVVIDGRQHVDGGLVDPTGLDTAIELGARRVYVLDSGYAGRLPAPLGSMNAIVDHAFQIAAQHRTRWTIQQMGRSVEIVHLRPDAGFLRHSMDFGATDFYLNEGYRYAAQVLDSRGKRRRSMPEFAPTVAPVYH